MACWRYIETNPIRAGIVKDAADYRFSSYGVWAQSGTHPCKDSFSELLLPMLGKHYHIENMTDLLKTLKGDLSSTTTHPESTGSPSRFSMSILHRIRFWVDGLVIGSELYVYSIMKQLNPKIDILRHHLTRSDDTSPNPTLFSWRRVRAIAP